jgi:MFS family permease
MTDVSDIIDSQPIGRGQIVLAALCSAVLFMDGFDTQAIGYVAPALAKAWALPRGALGPVFSASLAGLMAGALTLGPLADRIGRKWIILASTAVFGLLSLATMAADSANTLLVLRFLTGLGLGGAMPNAIALTAEFSPLRRRASMVMLMFCGFSVGAAVGGLIALAAAAVRLAVGVPCRRRGPVAAAAAAGRSAPGISALPRRVGWRGCSGRARPDGNVPVTRLPAGHTLHRHRSEADRPAGPPPVSRPACPRDIAAVDSVLHEPAGPVLPVKLAADIGQ